jgi:hypothetical protein
MTSDQISTPCGGDEQVTALRSLLLKGEVTFSGENAERQSLAAPVREVLVRILTYLQGASHHDHSGEQ